MNAKGLDIRIIPYVIQGLETVDWDSLWHAHGSAQDVPSMLLALLKPETGPEACAELHETVWHLGTVYPASAAILPFLFQIVRTSPDVHLVTSPDRLAVSVIVAICTGEGWVQHRVSSLGEEGARAQMENIGRDSSEERSLETETMLTIRQTLISNAALLEKYRHEGEGLGEMVSELLSSLESTS